MMKACEIFFCLRSTHNAWCLNIHYWLWNPHEIPIFAGILLAKYTTFFHFATVPWYTGAAPGGKDTHARHPQSAGARSDLQRCWVAGMKHRLWDMLFWFLISWWFVHGFSGESTAKWLKVSGLISGFLWGVTKLWPWKSLVDSGRSSKKSGGSFAKICHILPLSDIQPWFLFEDQFLQRSIPRDTWWWRISIDTQMHRSHVFFCEENQVFFLKFPFQFPKSHGCWLYIHFLERNSLLLLLEIHLPSISAVPW